MIIKLQQFRALIWKWNIGFRHVQFLWRLCTLILLLKLKLYSSMVLVSLWQFDTDSNISQMRASHLRNCYRLINLMRIFVVVVVIVVHRFRRSQPIVSSSNSRQGGMHEKCSWTNLSASFLQGLWLCSGLQVPAQVPVQSFLNAELEFVTKQMLSSSKLLLVSVISQQQRNKLE